MHDIVVWQTPWEMQHTPISSQKGSLDQVKIAPVSRAVNQLAFIEITNRNIVTYKKQG